MNKAKFETPNLTAENLKKLADLFPGVVTEGKVNVDLLRSYVGEEIFKDEAYEFTWVGKRAAIAEAGRPIRKTLRPCPEESRDWDTTENLYIEGDNLDVLKLLQESYLGKVKMIYIDPPYNTGNDFIYRDNFSKSREEYDEELGVYDEEGDRLFRNTESNGRFHSDWCSMMYPRLVLARNLLTSDGVIFISIDDGEVHNLRKVCDEVFGESCFVCSAIWRSSDNSNNDAKQFSNDHNSTLIYSKQPLWQPQKQNDPTKRTHFKNPDNDPRGPWFDGNPLNSPNYRENLIYDLISPSGKVIKPPKNGWRWSQETMQAKIASGEIRFTPDETNIKRRTYLCDMEGLPPSSLWTDLEQTGHNRQAKYELLNLMPEDIFDTPKPVRLIKFIINLVQDCKDAIILDFFSGSGTTAEAVMQCNLEDGGRRKFIMVQLPEDLDESLKKASNDNKQTLKNAIALCDKNSVPHYLSEIAKERIRRAGDKIKAENKDKPGIENLDIGFRVFKLDSTNMNDVYYAAGDYTQDMLSLMESNIKPDRNDMDLLFGCLLDWGLPLSMPHTHEKIDGFTVHTYNDGDLIACFEEHISEKAIREIANRKPLRAVFRDSSFSSSPEKINVFEIFKLLAPNTSVKVI